MNNWKAIEFSGDYGEDARIINDDGRMVAYVYPVADGAWGIAAQIVTAVNAHGDLLAALREIATFNFANHPTEDYENQLGAAVHIARAAIAKAEGR